MSLLARLARPGGEGPLERAKALVHTFLGGCYAVGLEGCGVDHIHVHHGYFGSWIAMTAARLLGVGFSMTLHGSDLLLHGTYLAMKLEACSFCLTISDYNRAYILEHYPQVERRKVFVSRLGVDVPEPLAALAPNMKDDHDPFRLLAVGRLHAVKDHAFLVRACAELDSRGVDFHCSIAGEGPERGSLESLIHECGLEERITLLGHVAGERMDALYDGADVVLLTSRSEGIPLVLMEAMARGRIVLAPAITGIPELVVYGQTGFLYEPGSTRDFVAHLLSIRWLMQAQGSLEEHSPVVSATRPLDLVRHAAREQVRHNFNRKTNLDSFADLFLEQVAPPTESLRTNENLVLQQI